MQVGALDPKM